MRLGASRIILILFLSVKWHLIPALGYKGFAYVILPAIVLAVEISPFIIRTLTTSLAEVMQSYFIDEAKVRGLPRRRIVFGHALRNASVPLINLLGIESPGLTAALALAERVARLSG